jgi:hypothetical protein
MSVLYFPNLDTLHLALTSGAVPPAVSLTPVVAAFADDGGVWLEPSASLPRAAQNDLRRLGVQAAKGFNGRSPAMFSCWPQLLPLRRDESAVPSGQVPVLFELATPGDLPALVGEMLRLGNDRQAFRWLRDDGDSPVLLRVLGPPYYSLLRALDRDGSAAAPRAFVERAPRVWVEVGHTHPLIEQLKAPDGKLVLLRPPRDWVYLDDAPFRDIYDILEFILPAAPARWQDAHRTEQMTVPVRLKAGGGQEPAELWVLRERAVETLDEFVRTSDDVLLNRLSFAVGNGDGREPIIVLRVRPSRLPPPVLTLPALAYRPFLKMPNLFLPVGMTLHPPLRRDKVRSLLADDPDVVTWLHPHGDGTFTPESLPEGVFRLLTDWVDYVLDHDRVALQAWTQSHQFDFEPFICTEGNEKPPDRKKGEAKEPRRDRKTASEAVADTASPAPDGATDAKKPRNQQTAEPLPELPRASPSELQVRLHALERRFLEIEGGLDALARQALWPQLAQLTTALGNLPEAALCWAHALWEDSPHAAAWAAAWARAENRGAGLPATRELDRILKAKPSSLPDARLLAAAVIVAAAQEPPPDEIVKRLRPIQECLLKHEGQFPVRIAWLLALALYRLSSGDVLALTRARDRLLERLFQDGLRADLDLPAFLRFSGARASDRFRAFREWLLPLPDRVRHWVHELGRAHSLSNPEDTTSYANLLLAYGMARLGEERQARALLDRAKQALADRDEVHTFLLNAFDFRITQALEGKPLGGTLPADFREYLEKLERIPRYMVDRLRQHSRILEPHEKINPYRAWQARYLDDLGQKLAHLTDIHARNDLEGAVRGLLAATGGKTPADRRNRARVVHAALGVAPRVGEEFATQLLPEVLPACATLDEAAAKADRTEQTNLLMEQAELLEKAIFLAAHFDQSASVQALVARFQVLLQALPRGAVDSLAGQCLRGLRKLGLRDEIHNLLGQMAAAVTEGQALATLRKRKDWPATLRTLLQVAAGWYYFGMDEEARPVLEEARTLLLHGELDAREQTKLACAYAATLGQAPADVALLCIDELFGQLTRVWDTFTTNTHYSLSQLDVIEAVVLAVVSEDFALGTRTRRWLDDEEFLIRRRVHADVHTLLEKH